MRQLLSALAIVSSILLQAQPELGYCEQTVDELAQKQLPRAQKAWRTGNFREAERYLKKAIDLDPNYADALYLLGDLYVRMLQVDKAEALWAKALEVCPNYKPELQYFLGSIYLENAKRDKAIAAFDAFLANPERDRGFDKEVKAAKEEAILLDKLLGNPVPFDPKPVRQISTEEDEYLGTISPDQSKLFFTRRTKKVNLKDGPAAKVRMVEEFSLSERLPDGQFAKGSALPNPFNQAYNEGGPSISGNNSELYFTVCQQENGYLNCDIYYSRRDAYGGWTVPASVGDHINQRLSWESQPSITADGDKLYFASNREGGKGGIDLYVCDRKRDGSWSAPRNLGAPINTRKDEKSPFIHSDSETLYFTSNGHPGLGGFDIFYARMRDTLWEVPQNIGYPINGEEDELGLFVSLDGKTGYFSSNKLRTNMGWDLYAFNMPDQSRPKAVQLITGTLEGEDRDRLTDARLELKNTTTQEVEEVLVDRNTGAFAKVVEAKEEKEYVLSLNQKGLAFNSRFIEIKPNAPIVKTALVANSIESDREYVLNDINFESNSYALDRVARAVIDEFIRYLKENPEIRADIQGHTDDVGNDNDNLLLSANRAKAVYDYVITNGIPASRLSHHGYGEQRPIANNDSEYGRAQNRRTVFVITAK